MTNLNLDSLSKILKLFSLGLTLLASSIMTVPAAAAGSLSKEAIAELISADAVGEVSLVLGKAYIESVEGNKERIKAGTHVHVGDQVITEASGTVHIGFIDYASVAVRQDSHLEVINYQFDPARPEKSKVKFNLVHGVTRAISGEAAKAAREQFRLNTPIAAIGVRGTDFVVSATGTSTEALVNEGIIVLAPLSANCSIDSFGPCVANSVELTGDSMEMIALDGTGSDPKILPAAQNRGSEVLQQDVRLQLAININNPAETGNEPYVEEVFVEEANSTQVATSTTGSAAFTGSPDFTPSAMVSSASLTSNQLVWGRFADGKGDLERITLNDDYAQLGRAGTIGDFEYTLYRDESDAIRVDRDLSVVNFALDSAQAFYNSSTGVVSMQVLDGSLGIDFQQNSFATELNLSHELTGAVDFIASGGLYDGGFFHSRGDDQRIAGSVSFDGTEAGYLFEKQLEGGFIDGLTLWNSP